MLKNKRTQLLRETHLLKVPFHPAAFQHELTDESEMMILLNAAHKLHCCGAKGAVKNLDAPKIVGVVPLQAMQCLEPSVLSLFCP